MSARQASRGQVLVMFVLFLLVLLGISALAIDYASWLLTDRNLQNTADHAALAGASQFDDRTNQGNCASGTGIAQCDAARAQAWTSLSDELGLGLNAAAIALLADNDQAAVTSVTAGGSTFSWNDPIWVATPPPDDGSYKNFGGRYARNFGVVWVRVDRSVPSFLGGALGIQPQARTGWATAGALPTDFALQLFCRNHIAPQSGVCVNSAGLTIDGQGGVRLIRGDIGSNESLTVTANTGGGVVLDAGNMFLVNRTCAPSTWNCPNSPPRGGISNGVTGKNAFYIAPLPVPQFQSPVDGSTVHTWNCSGASASALCVPFKSQASSTPTAAGDWTCSASSSTPVRCGAPTVDMTTTPPTVTCVGQGGGVAGNHYYPIGPSLNAVNATPSQSNANKYTNIDDLSGDPDTLATPQNPSVDYLWTNDINITGSGGPQTSTFAVNLGQSGPRLGGTSTVRYTAFKTDGGVPNNTLNPVTLQVSLLNGSGGTILADPTQRTLTDVPQMFEFTVGAGVIPSGQFNSLQLQFTFTSQGSTAAADERGGAIAWAEIEHPGPQPAAPPLIPPGYYQSIELPANTCAIMDPTAEYSTLQNFQMPGIYQFGGGGSANNQKIKIGDGAYLIGDGVTLVFDPSWPDSGANRGIAIGASGALVLNTARVPGVAPCTPTETETLTVNMSGPTLANLPHSSLCAAWGVDTKVSSGVRPGASAWEHCDTANPDSGAHCIERANYAPVPGYRGITFYFTPDPGWGTAHGSMNISNRFEMQGGSSGNEAGIAFRGVMYAPYDDVKITGGNGFNTVGQVMAWSAKFNGGSAYILLDYPYDFTPAAPYLLEPTIDH